MVNPGILQKEQKEEKIKIYLFKKKKRKTDMTLMDTDKCPRTDTGCESSKSKLCQIPLGSACCNLSDL